MKKHLSLIFMCLLSAASLIYAGVKHFDAERQAEIAIRAVEQAEKAHREAEMARVEAVRQHDLAEANAAMAMEQRRLAEIALREAESRSRKK